MKRHSRWLQSVVMIGFLAAVGMQLPASWGQEATAPGTKEAAVKETTAKEPVKRLPAYYKDVVDEAQRQKIYAIQAKFREKIAELAAQIKQLQAEQIDEIDALLSPAQKAKLAAVKAAAAKARLATAAAIKEADQAPAADKETAAE